MSFGVKVAYPSSLTCSSATKNETVWYFENGVTITYGRGDGSSDYKNFVGTDGTVFDGSGVVFSSVEIYEGGDANMDFYINMRRRK